MSDVKRDVQRQLFAMQDLSYKEFHRKLIPTVDPDTIIGVRTPALRKFARAFAKTPESEAFLRILPHKYYDENNLHGFLIETIRDYEGRLAKWSGFCPMWTTGRPVI